jgi:NarL family two-component system response regulator LiaR
MTEKIRILLADDHPVVRDGLAMMLNTQIDFEVVGAVDNGLEVLEVGEALNPDVLLLDLEMPELDGLETLKRIRQTCPDVRIIVFTAFDTDDRIVEAIQSGAKGYMLKGAPREEIFNAIRVVHSGGTLLQPMITSKLMEHISRQDTELERLTARETEVLKHMATGRQNKEIAADLVISERTVKFHISAILGKLGASNRTEAVSVALQRGLISLKDNP